MAVPKDKVPFNTKWSEISRPGGGGICKFRVALGSQDKSGGVRFIYYWAVRRDVILLLYAYPKNVTADLTPKQIAQLAKVVKEEFGNEKGDVQGAAGERS